MWFYLLRSPRDSPLSCCVIIRVWHFFRKWRNKSTHKFMNKHSWHPCSTYILCVACVRHAFEHEHTHVAINKLNRHTINWIAANMNGDGLKFYSIHIKRYSHRMLFHLFCGSSEFRLASTDQHLKFCFRGHKKDRQCICRGVILRPNRRRYRPDRPNRKLL